jgi:hypothetical protein
MKILQTIIIATFKLVVVMTEEAVIKSNAQ